MVSVANLRASAGCLLALILWPVTVGAQENKASPAVEASPGVKAAEAEREASAKGVKSTAADTAHDVQDTHQRLERIYQRLGRRHSDKNIPSWLSCNGGRSAAKPLKSKTLTLPPILGYILVGIIFAAVLIPLLLSLRKHLPVSPPRALVVPQDPGETAPDVRPWRVDLSECRGLAQQGRLIEAFAALHRLTLLQLEQSFGLRLEHNTTNWEYVRRLASRPETSALLAEVTRAAEQSVLGNSPPPAERYQILEQQVMEMGVQR